MDVLLVLENEFLHEIKRDGITSFMDFIMTHFGAKNGPKSIGFECFRGKMIITNSTGYLRP